MRYNCIVCDICGKEIVFPNKPFSFRVKSSYFVNYVNQEDMFANVKKVDICLNCVNKFKNFVKYEKV